MAVGELDIAVQVDATSAVAGFNKAAAANQKFLQSLLDASDPMRRITRDMERLTAMQASGEASAEQYARGMAELQRQANTLSASLSNVGKAAQGTTAGTEAAAAATQRWAAGLAAAGNPIAALNSQLERLKAAQVAGVLTAQQYREAVAGIQAQAAQLGGSIEAQRAAQERAAASAKAAAESQRQWALSLAAAADPMVRLNTELAELARLQKTGAISAQEYANATAAVQQKAAGIEGSIEGQARAMAKQAAEAERAAASQRQWAQSLADAGAPLTAINRELSELATAQQKGTISAETYAGATAKMQMAAASAAKEFPHLASSIDQHAAATARATAQQKAFINDLLSTSDPMVKINKQFADLKTAYASGAASADEYGRALAYLNSQAKIAGGSLGQLSAVGRGADRSMRGTAAAATNLTQQIQDIGIVAAMGQDPFTVMIQQGSQIAAVMGPMGASGALSTFKGVLSQLINPMTILSFAAVYLGTVLIQTFMKGAQSAEEMDKAAKKSRQEIANLAKAFPDLEKHITSFERKGISAMAGMFVEAQKLAKNMPEEIKKAFSLPEAGQLQPFMGFGPKDTIPDTVKSLDDLAKAADNVPQATRQVDEFYKMLRENAPGATQAFAASINAFDQGQQAAGKGRFGTLFINDADKMGEAAKQLEAQIKEAAHGSVELEAVMRDAAASLHDGTFSAREYQRQLEDLWRATDDPALQDYILKLIDANAAAVAAEEENERLGRSHEVLRQRLKLGEQAWADYQAAIAKSIEQSERGVEAFNKLKEAAVPDMTPLQELFRQRDEALANVPSGLGGDVNKQFEDAVKNLTGLTPQLAVAQEANNVAMEKNVDLVTALTAAYPALGEQLSATSSGFVEQQQLLAQYQSDLAAAETNLITAAQGLSTALDAAEFAPFQSAIDGLKASIASGKPDIEGFQTAVANIMKGSEDQKVQELGNKILNLSNVAGTAQAVVNQLNSIISLLGGTAFAQVGGIMGLVGALNELAGAQAALAGFSLGPMTEMAQMQDNLNKVTQNAAATAEEKAKAQYQYMQGTKRVGAEIEKQQQTALTNLMGQHDAQSAHNAQLKEANRILDEGNASAEQRAKVIGDIERRFAESQAKGKGGGGKGGGGGGAAAIDENRQWVESQLDAADSTRALQRELDKLNELYRQGIVTQQEYEIISKHLGEQMKDTAKDAAEAYDMAATFAQVMDQWGQQVASSLADAIVEGENLEDVFKDLLKQLLKMIIQMMILEPLMKSITGSMGGMGGGMGGMMPFMGMGGGGSWAPPGWYGRAANQNERAMNAMMRTGAVTRGGSSSGTVVASNRTSMGNMIINFGQMGKGGGIINPQASGDDARSTAFAKRIRTLIQGELVQQQRPGGLLWGTR